MTHPAPSFRVDDRAAALAFIGGIGFAHIFAGTPVCPMVVHAPVTVTGETLTFHVSRANRIVGHLEGTRVLVSVAGPDGYVSPNWYATPGDQVPTWNYVAAEIEGVVRRLDEAGLTEQLDALAAMFEPRENPWHRAKMNEAAFLRLRGAITGFALDAEAVRMTRKLSQNKSAEDRARVAAAFARQGETAIADAMRAALDGGSAV